jgi:hypothetical protein
LSAIGSGKGFSTATEGVKGGKKWIPQIRFGFLLLLGRFMREAEKMSIYAFNVRNVVQAVL